MKLEKYLERQEKKLKQERENLTKSETEFSSLQKLLNYPDLKIETQQFRVEFLPFNSNNLNLFSVHAHDTESKLFFREHRSNLQNYFFTHDVNLMNQFLIGIRSTYNEIYLFWIYPYFELESQKIFLDISLIQTFCFRNSNHSFRSKSLQEELLNLPFQLLNEVDSFLSQHEFATIPGCKLNTYKTGW
jgi:hypothetical protein